MKELIQLTDDDFEMKKVVVLYIGESELPRKLGKFDIKSKIFETKRTAKHILRTHDAIGFNLGFIKNHDIELILVRFNRKVLSVTKKHLLEKGIVAEFNNLDEQIFLPLEEFSVTNKKQKVKATNQFSLIM